jgi:ubiquinol-cytochrome c reductase cytochrome b/c1 subunit
LGSKPPDEIYVFWARIFTAYYFAFFLIVMPVVGLIETPRKLPGSISEAVLGRDEPARAGAAAKMGERGFTE